MAQAKPDLDDILYQRRLRKSLQHTRHDILQHERVVRLTALHWLEPQYVLFRRRGITRCGSSRIGKIPSIGLKRGEQSRPH
ncbi:hypothetical protein CI238_03116 [Colletotrichum incanum]|uniref:Uncharacterized protein n=1 Tax=Colletotrichum incanum TaxID=1573173 RepID=A0A161YAJ7_COLIC|nr:hypothetical protein CI238_03116 [Colletotrichum incanum]